MAIALAGLPFAVSDLLNVDVITFLRRAHKERLGLIAISEVEEGLDSTFLEYEKELKGEALKLAAAAIFGYPYLIQMVGFQI